jgi:hypothetical protein
MPCARFRPPALASGSAAADRSEAQPWNRGTAAAAADMDAAAESWEAMWARRRRAALLCLH